jgi:hypothetical protein
MMDRQRLHPRFKTSAGERYDIIHACIGYDHLLIYLRFMKKLGVEEIIRYFCCRETEADHVLVDCGHLIGADCVLSSGNVKSQDIAQFAMFLAPTKLCKCRKP